jgi:hypothetical protein
MLSVLTDESAFVSSFDFAAMARHFVTLNFPFGEYIDLDRDLTLVCSRVEE